VGLTFASTATIDLGTNTLTLDGDSRSSGITLGGVISGTGNIKNDTITGTGSDTLGVTNLTAANTFSGSATTVTNRGVIALGNVNALQNATLNTGASAGTQSSAVTGVDFISADNATNSLANRQANPITVGTASYEKWLKLYVDTAPANGVTNFKIWGDGATQTSTTRYYTGNYITGVTPVTTASTIANVVFTNYSSSGSAATWDTASYSATGATTRFVVFQLAVDSTCGPGNWTQETINYSYDET
jgi:hypothetical protein